MSIFSFLLCKIIYKCEIIKKKFCQIFKHINTVLSYSFPVQILCENNLNLSIQILLIVLQKIR